MELNWGLLPLFKKFEHICVVNVWFIISICKNELIFYANLFVTILSCFKKHNFSQQKKMLLEHLEFFAYMY